MKIHTVKIPHSGVDKLNFDFFYNSLFSVLDSADSRKFIHRHWVSMLLTWNASGISFHVISEECVTEHVIPALRWNILQWEIVEVQGIRGLDRTNMFCRMEYSDEFNDEFDIDINFFSWLTSLFAHNIPETEIGLFEVFIQQNYLWIESDREKAKNFLVELRIGWSSREIINIINSACSGNIRGKQNGRFSLSPIESECIYNKPSSSQVSNLIYASIGKMHTFDGWKNKSFLALTSKELSNLFNFDSLAIDKMETVGFKKIFPSGNYISGEKALLKEHPEQENTRILIGKSGNKDIYMYEEARLRHAWIIGQTGMGKSTIINRFIDSDSRQWNGFMVIDPHGELAENALSLIPKERLDDVIYIDLSDRSNVFYFDIFLKDTPHIAEEAKTEYLVGCFKNYFAAFWWARMDYYLRQTVLSIFRNSKEYFLKDINRILTDRPFRKEFIETCNDIELQRFWRDEFDNLPEEQIQEIISPIRNKFGAFSSNKLLLNLFSSKKNKVDIGEIMNSGKIIILNMNKGAIGEDAVNFIWSIFVYLVWAYAFQRTNIDKAERKPFFVYIDEFQNLVNPKIESIVSELRKYKLGLIVANQFTRQLSKTFDLGQRVVSVLDALMGNVATIISFWIGIDDAEVLSKHFGQSTRSYYDKSTFSTRTKTENTVSPSDFTKLPPFYSYVKTDIGSQKEIFSLFNKFFVDNNEESIQYIKERMKRLFWVTYTHEDFKKEYALYKQRPANPDCYIEKSSAKLRYTIKEKMDRERYIELFSLEPAAILSFDKNITSKSQKNYKIWDVIVMDSKDVPENSKIIQLIRGDETRKDTQFRLYLKKNGVSDETIEEWMSE